MLGLGLGLGLDPKDLPHLGLRRHIEVLAKCAHPPRGVRLLRPLLPLAFYQFFFNALAFFSSRLLSVFFQRSRILPLAFFSSCNLPVLDRFEARTVAFWRKNLSADGTGAL